MDSIPEPQEESVITAAGGILLRKSASGEEQICIVLRKEHKDWTLPKGKLKAGESFQLAAQREVKEETGWDNELDDYLGPMGYKASGMPKVVLFWRMSPGDEGEVSSKDEIIKAEWVSILEALKRLTYEAEKEFLARVMGALDGHELEPVHPGYSWLDRLFHLKRARARLARECEVFRIELDFLKGRSHSSDVDWARAAMRHLSAAKAYEKAREIEGGWVCLHAAQRQTVFGLDQRELCNRADTLRRWAMTKTIATWRAEAIANSLAGDEQLTPERVSFAMALRDEHFANQYHKVWLTGDQLLILVDICVPALLIFVILIGFYSRIFSGYSAADAWNWPPVLAVMILGLLGASFSCAQSLIGNTGTKSIPERVADHYVTVTRIFSGAIAGLASYSFYVSKAFALKGVEGIGAAFTIAFIFGYTGEKLIARVANVGNDKNS